MCSNGGVVTTHQTPQSNTHDKHGRMTHKCKNVYQIANLSDQSLSKQTPNSAY